MIWTDVNVLQAPSATQLAWRRKYANPDLGFYKGNLYQRMGDLRLLVKSFKKRGEESHTGKGKRTFVALIASRSSYTSSEN